VDEGVMTAAEQDEVVERGLSTACPVLDVMRIDESVVFAAGEAAAAVAGIESAPQRGRNRPGLAPHAYGLAVSVADCDDRAVAADASGGLRGDGRAVLERAAAFTVLFEHVCVDVHDHLVAIRGRAARF
jgi:hypothetical protein